MLLIFQSCLESPDMTDGIVNERLIPLVTSGTASSYKDGTLTFEGRIDRYGKSNKITKKGFYWTLSSDTMDIKNNIVTASGDTEFFNCELKNVPGDTILIWRAFATNRDGTDYGEIKQYHTPAIIEEKLGFPSWGRKNFGTFSINNNIYMACGELPVTSEVWEYNIRDNKWRQNLDLNFIGGVRRCPVAFVIGDTAYVGTGERFPGAEHSDFYKLDGKSKTWSMMPLAGMEVGAPKMSDRYLAVGFSLNKKGYVVGGYSINHALKDVWQYSTENGGFWTKMHDFPVDFFNGICAYNEERVFVGFGNNAQSGKTLWEYDAKTDTWNEFAELPDAIEKKIYSGVLVQDRIYIVDGDNDIWELNLSDKIWKKKRTLPDVFLKEDGSGGDQNLIIVPNSNSIYVGLGLTEYFYEYRPLWDN